MNEWNGIGNLTDDPKVSRGGEKGIAVARFTVAINEGFGDKKRTDYIRVVTFGKTAENVEKYVFKGSKVGVTGRIETGSYTNKEGQKVYTTEVNAKRVEFLPKANDTMTMQTGQTYGKSANITTGFEITEEPSFL